LNYISLLKFCSC